MKGLFGLLSIICTFLMPIKALVLMVMLFTLLDTITGIYAAIRIGGRKEFRSGKLWNLVPKVFMYSVTILLSFLVDSFVLGGTTLGIKFLISKACSVLWTYVEVKSIDENSQKLGNRPFLDVVKELLRKAASLKKDINKIV